MATETSSTLRGSVTDYDGTPVGGSTVVITNRSTGFTKTITTDENGEFNLRGLPVGDDYTVVVSKPTYDTTKAEDVVLNVGKVSDLAFNLTQNELEVVTVVASADLITNVAPGPSAVFGLDQLQKSPAINRNIADVLRSDPRIFVDESRGDINSIQCGGQNPRFNSLTVDGVRMNDSFGLNSNGYPTERMPFSFDAIEQVAVEMAPFDVVYGGFTACNVNAVTKSGGNEIHGSVFFDYTNDSLKGSSLEGDDINQSDYDESRYGFTFGAPIIEDKLSFFVAYEKLEGVNTFDRGPLGSGAVNEVEVSQADLDRIVDIAQTKYQYDPGFIPTSFDNEDEKILVKLDWNINEDHRASFTYNYNDGYNIVPSDGDLNELEFSNHLYERGAELNSYVGTWYAYWSDRLSTEVRASYLEVDNRQLSLGGNDFGEIRIDTGDVDVYIGGDDSRQSNELNYDVTTFAFKGFYDLDEHFITFGYEREALEVFNLFVQHTETEIRFSSIDDFENGLARAIYYNNAPSGNPADAAAEWGYALNTAFVQDEYSLDNGMTVMFGLRYDFYSSDDKPEENPDFVADYGFSNSTNLDGKDLLQPRLGFNWDFSQDVTFRGGIGLFSGGNPNVWLSNNFSNNNVLQFGQRGRSFQFTPPRNEGDYDQRSLFDDDVTYEAVEEGAPNGPGYGVPSELYDAVAAGDGANFEINYLDPDFEIPSQWKYALGTTVFLPNDYTLNADLIMSSEQNTAIILRGDLEQVGVTDEGYPDYDSVREPTFVLTNSDKGNQSTVASISLQKFHENGIDWTLGYAYSDAKDVQPMTSSVAFSNYQNRAFFDPQEQVLSTSNYNIKHRFTGIVNYEAFLWGDNATTVSLYAAANQGPAYSRTVGSNEFYGFTPFLDGTPVLAPGTDRNSETGSWWAKADLKIEQELGGVMDEDKLSAYIVIDNLTNLLNDDWGVLRQANFPGNVPVDQEQAEARRGDASLYEIRFGMNYDF